MGYRTSREFRAYARECLRGRWGTAILVCLVAALLGGTEGGSGSGAAAGGSSSSAGSFSGITDSLSPDRLLGTDVGQKLLLILGVSAVILLIFGVVLLLIGGAIELGKDSYFISIARGEQGRFGQLFGCFDRFGRALALRLLRGLFLTFWVMVFVIPCSIVGELMNSYIGDAIAFVGIAAGAIAGIVAACRYALSAYLMADQADIGPLEAIRLSKKLMVGNKMRIFCLEMSFIGWILLGILSFGIGMLWVNPYMETACAAFYLEVSGQNAVAE